MIGEQVSANVAEARTVEVLQATATRIAEQKIQTTLAVDVTIPMSREQMNAVAGYAIPLHEQAPTAPTIEPVLGASSIYNMTVYPTLSATPHTIPPAPAPVSAGIYAAGEVIASATPAATLTVEPSAWPTNTPAVLAIETIAATADEREWDATPTPFPTATEQPTIAENPTPMPTPAPIATSTPQPVPIATETDTATSEPTQTEVVTITPPPVVTATEGPLNSPLPTPTSITTETPVP
jgi:hypothetical protein